MSDFDSNPFSDPFADRSVTDATGQSSKADLQDYNPFASQGQSNSQPAVVEPTSNPVLPAYTPSPIASSNPQPTPQQQAALGKEELLKRQEELERKAEELAKREQQLNSGNYNARTNNWPPLPSFCPVGPCFFQDFDLEIPVQSQTTVKLIYYAWLFYSMLMFLNMIASAAMFYADNKLGVNFGLSILWFVVNTPCSLCWYRPAYNAFRSDSSFWFFFFFFIMFAQVIMSIIQAVGIPNAGYAGWITSLGVYGSDKGQYHGIGVLGFIISAMFTFNVLVNIFLLKRVHEIYRQSGASFEKAQQEFASGVVKNPGVQQAAGQAAAAAVRGS